MLTPLYLTRAQVDSLITRFPAWMAESWPKIKRKWCVNGVRLSCTQKTILELASKLGT